MSDRMMVHAILDTMISAFPEGLTPGFALLIMANEKHGAPGVLEIDAGFRFGGCYTEEGKASIKRFAETLRGSMNVAVEVITTGEGGSVTYVDPTGAGCE